MKIAFFSTQPYDQTSFAVANAVANHQLVFFKEQLSPVSAAFASGCTAVCCFVNDAADAAALRELANAGIPLLLLRCAWFNNVDLVAAADNGITVMRVPAYSPHAVAEHTIALLLSVNRRIHRAWSRVRDGDFRLQGLLGFDLYQKTAGIIGTGRIGRCVAEILLGFGCQILAVDQFPDSDLQHRGVRYVELAELLSQSHVITLHCPLTTDTHHLINAATLSQMRPECLLINTGRGALVDTKALIEALKNKRIGGVGLDVYEEESGLFFADHSDDTLTDDVFARLLTFSNVLITGHQGFFTQEALAGIAETTLSNADSFAAGNPNRQCVVSSRCL